MSSRRGGLRAVWEQRGGGGRRAGKLANAIGEGQGIAYREESKENEEDEENEEDVDWRGFNPGKQWANESSGELEKVRSHGARTTGCRCGLDVAHELDDSR